MLSQQAEAELAAKKAAAEAKAKADRKAAEQAKIDEVVGSYRLGS
jgi:membrane protein involved in colicin uptake